MSATRIGNTKTTNVETSVLVGAEEAKAGMKKKKTQIRKTILES